MSGLFETLGYDGESLRNLPLHLDRMARSAHALGLPFSLDGFRAALDALPLAPDQDALVRVELLPGGGFIASARPFDALDLPVRLGLSVLRVSSRDPNLRHKRTDRRLYETAADEAARRGLDDVVLRNERGHLTETSRFALFVDPGDGHWRTPRLENGLLPGVLRGLLVGYGVAHEVDLTVEDLRTATRIAVGNSARGLLPATYVDPHAATG